jgi:hypothetical protein
VSALTLGGAAVGVSGLLSQTATNTNTGTLDPATLMSYMIGSTPYDDGDPISWGTMSRGPNTVTYSVTNLLTDTPITVAILNGTMPDGWTLTASTTTIQPSSTVGISVTVTVPETAEAGTYSWPSSVYAET